MLALRSIQLKRLIAEFSGSQVGLPSPHELSKPFQLISFQLRKQLQKQVFNTGEQSY
jgi:hypothetical protein